MQGLQLLDAHFYYAISHFLASQLSRSPCWFLLRSTTSIRLLSLCIYF